jgi:chemotaxis protein CheX
MSEMKIRLARTLDLLAAAPLKAELAACAGAPVLLDASGVERMGGQCLQVLLAAQQKWRADDLAFFVSYPSEAFTEDMRVMGASGLLQEQSMEEVCS